MTDMDKIKKLKEKISEIDYIIADLQTDDALSVLGAEIVSVLQILYREKAMSYESCIEYLENIKNKFKNKNNIKVRRVKDE
jgi:hypothetical protein